MADLSAWVDDPNGTCAHAEVLLDLVFDAADAVFGGEDFPAEKRGMRDDLLIGCVAVENGDVGNPAAIL